MQNYTSATDSANFRPLKTSSRPPPLRPRAHRSAPGRFRPRHPPPDGTASGGLFSPPSRPALLPASPRTHLPLENSRPRTYLSCRTLSLLPRALPLRRTLSLFPRIFPPRRTARNPRPARTGGHRSVPHPTPVAPPSRSATGHSPSLRAPLLHSPPPENKRGCPPMRTAP